MVLETRTVRVISRLCKFIPEYDNFAQSQSYGDSHEYFAEKAGSDMFDKHVKG